MKKIILILTALCMVCATGCGAVEKTVNKIYEKTKSGVDKPIVQSCARYANDAFIDEDGNLYMTGNYIGDGTDKDYSMPVKVMENVRSVSVGYHCAAAITNDDELYTWGYDNEYGRLGQGKETEKSYEPVKIMDNVDSVDYSEYYAFALTKDGKLYMWGGKERYKSKYNTYSPSLIMENVKSADHDDENAAAINYDGELYTWRTNLVNSMETADTYVIKVLDDVKMVSAGYRAYSAITTDGSLYTWGSQFYTSEVYGHEMDSSYDGFVDCPYKIMDNVRHTQMTGSQGIAITEDDDLYIWGHNTVGLIGNGTVTEKGVSTPFKVLDNVEYAYVNNDPINSNVIALKKDGSLYAWGDNIGNIFGDIEKEYEDDPEHKIITIQMARPEKIMDNVESVNMIRYHILAVTKDKEAYRLPPTDIKNLISSDNKEKMVFAE